MITLAAAAAVLAVALVVGILPGILGHRGDDQPMASAVTMSKVAETPINATVTLTGFGWGTRIDMVCTYGDYASRGQATTENLSMVLLDHNGTQNEIATWVGVNGATALPSGNTTLQKDQIKSVQLVDTDTERCCCNQICESGHGLNRGHSRVVSLAGVEAGERMAKTQRVVDHIVGYLAATGVEYIFGVDGANIEDLYDAAHFHDDITAVLAKHEFSAATMADGFSRSGAGLGVVAATSGGGCLNTVAGLGESLASRVPVLALIGQPPTNLDGRGAFQDTSGRNGALNGEALFSAVSVFCRRVMAPEEIITALPQAIAAANRGGPAVLLLPKDIQQSVLDLRASVQRRHQWIFGWRSAR